MKNEKKINRLWWEYLKRSEDYKKFCDWMKEREKNPELPEPKKYKKFIMTYFHFRNVHSCSFEEWWNFRKKRIKKFQSSKAVKAVDYYSNYADKDIETCIESFMVNKKREPSLQEFKNYFPKLLETFSPWLQIVVDPNVKTDVLVEEFKTLIKSYKKDPQRKKIEKVLNAYYEPTTKLRVDELKRYLEVYDLKKKGMKINEIIKVIRKNATDDECKNIDIQRAFRRDLSKAKSIIKNVEDGFFPGTYN